MTPTEAYELKGRAHSVLHAAIARGEIPRLDGLIRCCDCGKIATEYDLRNYFQPLRADAVCHSCNVKRGPGYPVVWEKRHWHIAPVRRAACPRCLPE